MRSYGNGKYGSRQKKNGLIPRQCEICGYTFLVTKHRIKPGNEGGKYIPGNVIGLCPNHHAEADRGAIPRWVQFRIVYRRLRKKHGQIEGEQLTEDVILTSFALAARSD